ncbi:MAG: Txe/YoeB family addiction module toxin [Desulfovibrio sp.]|jgi:Txe/YoeB family toxin of toxin-antitoxin system|nr:Txe/YoeB family addiction module toxin [Desulfovibrio sp.]
MYKLILTPQAGKDAIKLEQTGLKPKAVALLRVLRENPYQNPPRYEKLHGYDDAYSRRINLRHRLVYQILPNVGGEKDEYCTPYDGIIKIIRMWTHYE